MLFHRFPSNLMEKITEGEGFTLPLFETLGG
jgi:hypothetical protein